MRSHNNKIPCCAGIVTFNPDVMRLKENINSIAPQVDSIIIIDNCSDNLQDIAETISQKENIVLIKNHKNFGLATALNQIMNHAIEHGYRWVITLDQDSVSSESLVNRYLPYTAHDDIGMMTCLIKDRNSKRNSYQHSGSEYDEVEKCFTSGCFMNTKAWKSAGGFNERMFIDYVDYDLCMRMREIGYRIICINYLGLLHEQGHSKDITFLGKNFVVYNHPSFRKYYIVRNRIYYIKKYSKYLNAFIEVRHLLGFCVLVVLFEDQKIKKTIAMLKGAVDSIGM